LDKRDGWRLAVVRLDTSQYPNARHPVEITAKFRNPKKKTIAQTTPPPPPKTIQPISERASLCVERKPLSAKEIYFKYHTKEGGRK
jgi:hypothetical protein